MEGNIKNNNETPGDRVRKIRKKLGLTQEKFAERLDINSFNYISMIETGARDLPVDLSKKIAALLPPTRFEWIMGFDDYRTDDDRLASIINGKHEITDLIEQLMILHGYKIETEEVTPNIESLSDSEKQEYLQKPYLETRYYLKGPNNTKKFFDDPQDITRFFNEISEFVHFKCWNYIQPPFSDYLHTRKKVD